MDYHSMNRKDLQALCKKYNLLANGTNDEIADRLSSHLKMKPVVVEEEKKSKSKKVRFCLEVIDLTKSEDRRNIRKIEDTYTKKSNLKPGFEKSNYRDVPARSTRSRKRVTETEPIGVEKASAVVDLVMDEEVGVKVTRSAVKARVKVEEDCSPGSMTTRVEAVQNNGNGAFFETSTRQTRTRKSRNEEGVVPLVWGNVTVSEIGAQSATRRSNRKSVASTNILADEAFKINKRDHMPNESVAQESTVQRKRRSECSGGHNEDEVGYIGVSETTAVQTRSVRRGRPRGSCKKIRNELLVVENGTGSGNREVLSDGVDLTPTMEDSSLWMTPMRAKAGQINEDEIGTGHSKRTSFAPYNWLEDELISLSKQDHMGNASFARETTVKRRRRNDIEVENIIFPEISTILTRSVKRARPMQSRKEIVEQNATAAANLTEKATLGCRSIALVTLLSEKSPKLSQQDSYANESYAQGTAMLKKRHSRNFGHKEDEVRNIVVPEFNSIQTRSVTRGRPRGIWKEIGNVPLALEDSSIAKSKTPASGSKRKLDAVINFLPEKSHGLSNQDPSANASYAQGTTVQKDTLPSGDSDGGYEEEQILAVPRTITRRSRARKSKYEDRDGLLAVEIVTPVTTRRSTHKSIASANLVPEKSSRPSKQGSSVIECVAQETIVQDAVAGGNSVGRIPTAKKLSSKARQRSLVEQGGLDVQDNEGSSVESVGGSNLEVNLSSTEDSVHLLENTRQGPEISVFADNDNVMTLFEEACDSEKREQEDLQTSSRDLVSIQEALLSSEVFLVRIGAGSSPQGNLDIVNGPVEVLQNARDVAEDVSVSYVMGTSVETSVQDELGHQENHKDTSVIVYSTSEPCEVGKENANLIENMVLDNAAVGSPKTSESSSLYRSDLAVENVVNTQGNVESKYKILGYEPSDQEINLYSGDNGFEQNRTRGENLEAVWTSGAVCENRVEYTNDELEHKDQNCSAEDNGNSSKDTKDGILSDFDDAGESAMIKNYVDMAGKSVTKDEDVMPMTSPCSIADAPSDTGKEKQLDVSIANDDVAVLRVIKDPVGVKNDSVPELYDIVDTVYHDCTKASEVSDETVECKGGMNVTEEPCEVDKENANIVDNMVPDKAAIDSPETNKGSSLCSSDLPVENVAKTQGDVESKYKNLGYKPSDGEINLFSADNEGSEDTGFEQNKTHGETLEAAWTSAAVCENRVEDTNDELEHKDQNCSAEDNVSSSELYCKEDLNVIMTQQEKEQNTEASVSMPFAAEEAELYKTWSESTPKNKVGKSITDEINFMLTRMYISSARKEAMSFGPRRVQKTPVRLTAGLEPYFSVRNKMKENIRNPKVELTPQAAKSGMKRRALGEMQGSGYRRGCLEFR